MTIYCPHFVNFVLYAKHKSAGQSRVPTALMHWVSGRKLDVLVLQIRCHSILASNQFSTSKNDPDGKHLCLSPSSASCFIMNMLFAVFLICFLQYPSNVVCQMVLYKRQRQVIYDRNLLTGTITFFLSFDCSVWQEVYNVLTFIDSYWLYLFTCAVKQCSIIGRCCL